MGSRDRPHKEVKKKPQAKDAKAKQLQPLMEPPTNVEVIKPTRKPRHVDTDES